MPPQRQAKTHAAARIRNGTEAGRSRTAQSTDPAKSSDVVKKEAKTATALSKGNSGPGVKAESKVKTEPRAYTRDAISDDVFGLIQERYQHNLYHLVVQAILWNQTRGKQARVVLEALLEEYPDAEALSQAREGDLEELLYPIGLYKQRAKRLKALGQAWLERPPCKEMRYKARAREYAAGEDCDKPGWEIAHLPGVGPYALDSYRIFYRDQLRGLAKSWDDDFSARAAIKQEPGAFEPEWKRVVPLDKDLRAFLIWAWAREGYKWDALTGKKAPIDSNTVL